MQIGDLIENEDNHLFALQMDTKFTSIIPFFATTHPNMSLMELVEAYGDSPSYYASFINWRLGNFMLSFQNESVAILNKLKSEKSNRSKIQVANIDHSVTNIVITSSNDMNSGTSNYNSGEKQLCDVSRVSEADTNLLSSQLSPKAGPSGLQVINQPSLTLPSPTASISSGSSKIVTNLSSNPCPSSISPKVQDTYQAQQDLLPNDVEIENMEMKTQMMKGIMTGMDQEGQTEVHQ